MQYAVILVVSQLGGGINATAARHRFFAAVRSHVNITKEWSRRRRQILRSRYQSSSPVSPAFYALRPMETPAGSPSQSGLSGGPRSNDSAITAEYLTAADLCRPVTARSRSHTLFPAITASGGIFPAGKEHRGIINRHHATYPANAASSHLRRRAAFRCEYEYWRTYRASSLHGLPRRDP